jgi:hypothetical protein
MLVQPVVTVVTFASMIGMDPLHGRNAELILMAKHLMISLVGA